MYNRFTSRRARLMGFSNTYRGQYCLCIVTSRVFNTSMPQTKYIHAPVLCIDVAWLLAGRHDAASLTAPPWLLPWMIYADSSCWFCSTEWLKIFLSDSQPGVLKPNYILVGNWRDISAAKEFKHKYNFDISNYCYISEIMNFKLYQIISSLSSQWHG